MNFQVPVLFFFIFNFAVPATPFLVSHTTTINIPLGGNTFQTQGNALEKVDTNGLMSWENADTQFSVYVKSEADAPVTLAIDILSQVSDSKINIEINGQNHLVNLGAESSGLIPAGHFRLIKGYNEIKLQGVEKSGINFVKVKNLQIKTDSELNLEFVKDNIDNRFYWGRRGPSVHLNYTLAKDKNFKWFYNEVTVPNGFDPIGSYFMANGFAEGYFGIQVNSEQERRILFSVWSPYQTDNPGEIPEAEKIVLLKKGDGVYTGEFGNEGSGGQSFLKFKWKAGTTYGFLNSVEPDGKGNTIYTAYFMDPEVGQWSLIASFLRPKTDTWYKRPHSFLENFVPESGFLERTVNYSNQWVADASGNWQELTEAKFTGDDIAKREYRKDYEGGEKTEHFYLRNGGFFNGDINLNSIHQRKSTSQPPLVNFDKLP